MVRRAPALKVRFFFLFARAGAFFAVDAAAVQLILAVVFVRCTENAIQTILDQTLKRTLKLCVRVRIFELKKVQVPFFLIKMKSINPVIVAAKSHLVERLLAGHSMFAF